MSVYDEIDRIWAKSILYSLAIVPAAFGLCAGAVYLSSLYGCPWLMPTLFVASGLAAAVWAVVWSVKILWKTRGNKA